jgi:hypothetical protein
VASLVSITCVTPGNYLHYQNYPNPFNPNTIIIYSKHKLSSVVIEVFDIIGNKIETLLNEEKQTGTYEVIFNSHSGNVRNLPAGRQGLPSRIYFCQLKAGSFIETGTRFCSNNIGKMIFHSPGI